MRLAVDPRIQKRGRGRQRTPLGGVGGFENSDA